MIRPIARSSSWLLVVLAVAAPSAFADEKEAAADLKKMQGEWVSMDETGESTWTFKDDKVSLKTPTRSYELVAKLDADAKPERSIDLTATDDSPDAKGASVVGIYKFDGEKLLICFNGPEGQRPTEFKSDFPKQLLFELKKKS